MNFKRLSRGAFTLNIPIWYSTWNDIVLSGYNATVIEFNATVIEFIETNHIPIIIITPAMNSMNCNHERILLPVNTSIVCNSNPSITWIKQRFIPFNYFLCANVIILSVFMMDSMASFNSCLFTIVLLHCHHAFTDEFNRITMFETIDPGFRNLIRNRSNHISI